MVVANTHSESEQMFACIVFERLFLTHKLSFSSFDRKYLVERLEAVFSELQQFKETVSLKQAYAESCSDVFFNYYFHEI